MAESVGDSAIIIMFEDEEYSVIKDLVINSLMRDDLRDELTDEGVQILNSISETLGW